MAKRRSSKGKGSLLSGATLFVVVVFVAGVGAVLALFRPPTAVPRAAPQNLAAVLVTSTHTTTPARIFFTATPTDALEPTATTLSPTRTPRPQPTQTIVYVTGTRNANVRAEPSTTGALVTALAPGTELIVMGIANGDAVAGSQVWYAIRIDDKAAYIHSSLTAATRPVVVTRAPASIQQLNPTSTTALQSVPTNPPPLATVAPPTPAPASNMCNGIDDLNCSDFRTSRDATNHLLACGTDEDRLDQDNNGLACESLP